MFSLTPMEIFFRCIPESILLVLGIYVFSKKEFCKKILLQNIFYLAIGIIIIRSLPISYGIHTMLIICLLILLATSIGKIDVTATVRAAVMVMLTLSISEFINITWIRYVLRKDLDTIFGNIDSKIIYGIPSLMIMGFAIYLAYEFYYKRIKERDRKQ